MALYAISIRQARDLPPPFFRFCLTADTLGLSYILPAAGRIRDFHPLERALTGRTQKSAVLGVIPRRRFFSLFIQSEARLGRETGFGAPCGLRWDVFSARLDRSRRR